jgi:hypothetical protein
LYRKAAEQGFANAENQLGMLYKDGNGVPRDDQQAATWFRKAADQGYSAAVLNLGWMYANGRGVVKAYEQALSWYRKAAAHGADVQPYQDDLPSDVRDQAGQFASTSTLPSETARPPATGSTSQGAGSLSGKLSLITGSGDLKPARLADLVLLYADSKDSPALRYSTAVESKVNAYSDNCKAEAAKIEADTKAGRFSTSGSSCGVEEAIACDMVIIGKKTLRETLDASKASQFQETQADEEGVFSFSKVPPGLYYLVAFGRAGLNEANWRTLVTIKAGEDVVVKLPSPVASCFMGPN